MALICISKALWDIAAKLTNVHLNLLPINIIAIQNTEMY